jgi:cysteine desulfurase
MRLYFDCNATAPLRPEARDAMLAALGAAANPSSVHAEGRAARRRVEQARAVIAGFAGAAPDAVTFTSGGTEANALAIHGALHAAAEAGQRFTRLIVSAIEHDSVLHTARTAAALHPGLRLSEAAVTSGGMIDLAALRALLMEGKGRALVSIMAVNNETGVIQPTRAIASLCREYQALYHCDAVQAAGKVAAGLQDLDADMLTFSGHKVGGPQGVGAVVCRPATRLAPIVFGGRQENGLRAGTEATAAIAGFAAAISALGDPLAPTLRDTLEQSLLSACPDAVIFGRSAMRVGNTTCIAAPGVPAETLVIALDLEGFAVSAGAACSSGRVTRSHVLDAMGVDPDLAKCAIRISAGWNTTAADVAALSDAWKKIVTRARARVAA